MNKRLGYLGLLWVALWLAALVEAAPRDPATHFFDQGFGDFPEELRNARDGGKAGVFLFFETDDCPFCKRMMETVLNQPDVQDAFKARFMAFSVDGEGDVEITDFQGNTMPSKDFFRLVSKGRGATPLMAFFDLDGTLVVRYTGATRDKEEFLWLADFVEQQKYLEMRFSRYKRERRAASARP